MTLEGGTQDESIITPVFSKLTLFVLTELYMWAHLQERPGSIDQYMMQESRWRRQNLMNPRIENEPVTLSSQNTSNSSPSPLGVLLTSELPKHNKRSILIKIKQDFTCFYYTWLLLKAKFIQNVSYRLKKNPWLAKPFMWIHIQRHIYS